MSRPYRSDRELEAMVLDLVHRARTEHGIRERYTGKQACIAMGLRLSHRPLPEGVDGLLSDKEVVINTALGQARMQYGCVRRVL